MSGHVLPFVCVLVGVHTYTHTYMTAAIRRVPSASTGARGAALRRSLSLSPRLSGSLFRGLVLPVQSLPLLGGGGGEGNLDFEMASVL